MAPRWLDRWGGPCFLTPFILGWRTSCLASSGMSGVFRPPREPAQARMQEDRGSLSVRLTSKTMSSQWQTFSSAEVADSHSWRRSPTTIPPLDVVNCFINPGKHSSLQVRPLVERSTVLHHSWMCRVVSLRHSQNMGNETSRTQHSCRFHCPPKPPLPPAGTAVASPVR